MFSQQAVLKLEQVAENLMALPGIDIWISCVV